MSYLVLARKWRPQTFSEVVGQKPVVQTLQNALRRNRVSHAMIFSGVRGVGKTTLARIMAKALNCHNPDQAPCNACSSCREITAGTSLDLHEIDGASNRGIQEIRDLRENIRFQPARERYKIIIIDEVHMLTAEAFNALLKTLEEPPAHVHFMFATTELHKVPVTILSRCQRFELKRVPFRELVEFFQRVAAREGVEMSPAALEAIAREAEGSVRDGLSLLDQILSYGGEKIGEDDVRQVLGLVDRQAYLDLARSLLERDLPGSLTLFNRCYAQGIDLKRFANDLLLCYRALLVCRTHTSPETILDVSDRSFEDLQRLAGTFPAETLYSHFHLLLKGVDEMQHATHPRLTMEMTLIRLVQAGEVESVSAILSRLNELATSGTLSRMEPLPTPPPSPPLPTPLAPPPSTTATIPPAPIDQKTEANLTETVERPTHPAPPISSATPAEPLGGALAGPHDVRKHWDGFLAHIKEKKPWLAHALGLATGVKEDGGDLVIKFGDASECAFLKEAANLRMLTEFAQNFFQKDLVVRVKARGGDGQPAASTDAPHEERRALANDPLVQMTAEVLGGQVKGIRTSGRGR